MNRYIDAEMLIERWNNMSVRGRTEFDQEIMVAPSIDLADYVPKEFHDRTCEAMAKAHQEEIADMVSVVRCKECKCFNHFEDKEHGEWNTCERHMIFMNPNDFCSYGEREGER